MKGRTTRKMLGIPRRYGHFVFGTIQSGLTSAIAAGIASFPFMRAGLFLSHWIESWLLAWLIMLPVVILAAPFIQKTTDALTCEFDNSSDG
jgi:hypothetical protein